MANQLKMADLQALMALHRRGWSKRRIARELGIDRETVGRHIRAIANSLITAGERVTIGPMVFFSKTESFERSHGWPGRFSNSSGACTIPEAGWAGGIHCRP